VGIEIVVAIQGLVCCSNLLYSFLLSPSLTVLFLAHPLQVDGSVVFGVVIDVVYGGFLFGIIVLAKLTCHKSAY